MACRMSAGTVVWPLAVIVDSDITYPLLIDYCKEIKSYLQTKTNL